MLNMSFVLWESEWATTSLIPKLEIYNLPQFHIKLTLAFILHEKYTYASSSSFDINCLSIFAHTVHIYLSEVAKT